MPADANPNGDIFGGWLMGLMDLAGGNATGRRAWRRERASDSANLVTEAVFTCVAIGEDRRPRPVPPEGDA